MRTFRLIATPVILLGLLGILLWAASWGWRSLTAPLPSPSPTPCVMQAAEMVTPANVTVRVFNGGSTSGLARQVGGHLESYGFVVARTANADERITKTIIRGNARDQAQLDLVASYIEDSTIEHDDRVDSAIDVLVGSQFASFAAEPLTEVPADSGNICVPPPSPEPSPEAEPSQ